MKDVLKIPPGCASHVQKSRDYRSWLLAEAQTCSEQPPELSTINSPLCETV